MRYVGALLCFAAVIAFAAPARADAFTLGGPTPAGTVDIPSPGFDIVLNSGIAGTITDLNLEIKIEGGGYTVNLDILLTHGATSVLVYDGGLTDFDSEMDTTFDDESPNGPAPKDGPQTGPSYTPDNPLSAFDGMELAGPWTLTISDDTIYPNEGEMIIEWSLTGEYRPPNWQQTPNRTIPEPGMLALFALGLGGLYLGRRRSAQR